MNAIEIQHLTHRYGRTEALHDLSFEVPEGSVFSLLGPNGAGKTTTIKILMSLLQPRSGDVRVFGVKSRQLSPHQLEQIGYVSENQQLPLWMTVRQLLDFCRPFYPTWDTALEEKLLVQFALPPGRKLKHLSRGQLMKASLLSSLAYRPKLLVLDEPFSGLDPVARDDFVRGLIEAAGEGGGTVLVSSHDIEEVERLTDHVALLDSGKLRLTETVEALFGRFRRVEMTLSTPVGDSFAPEPGWQEVDHIGNRWRFVETRFHAEASEARWRQTRPNVTEIVVQPMSLREIYISLARNLTGAPAQKSA